MFYNFQIFETPISDHCMAAKLAETIYNGDVKDIDAIRATASELLFGANRENNPTFANCVDHTESVDVFIMDDIIGLDKVATFNVRDLRK